MQNLFSARVVIKWVAIAAVAIILVAVGRAVWRYSETALALTVEPPSPTAATNPDPGVALGVQFEDVEIRADDGALAAWQIAGGERWLVSIPSRTGNAADGHRAVPAAMRAGFTVLETARRDPADDAAVPDADAWRAVHAAVRYAERQGAEKVTLCAFGDGAIAVTQFLTMSEFAALVDAVVLDGASLDLNATVRAGLEAAGIPGYLIGLSRQTAALRFDVRWSELDLTDRLAAAELPLLVIQGGADGYAGAGIADAFVERIGSLATYLEVPGAGHLQAAQADPAAYDAAVLAFLTALP